MPQRFNKIILAGDREDLAGMADLLAQHGLEVHLCKDGVRALELTLTLFPDMMALDTGIPLLPAGRLSQILLSNPHTDRIAFFYIGGEDEEIDGFRRHKDFFLTRPFNPEQFLAAVLTHCSRLERTEQVGRQGKETRGSLAQISVTDLIQVLGVNRKGGTLSLTSDAGRGAIFMRDGQVINARLGRVAGEKAFFRLLGWTEGEFCFSPGVAGVEALIAASADHLIIEGLRQMDEMNAQAATLPAVDLHLELKVPKDRLPLGLRPTTQEILMLTEFYPRVQDLLDHCPRPDFEVLQVLKVLIENGLLEERKAPGVAEIIREPLLSADEILSIKDHFGDRDAPLDEVSVKLLLLVASAADLRNFLQVLQGLPEFEPAPDPLLGGERFGLGDLGRLRITETFSLRLFVLPATAEYGPLWAPFRRHLFGAISLAGFGRVSLAEEFFADCPPGLVTPVVFDEPRDGAFLLRRGERRAFRELLMSFATHFHRPPPERENA